MVDLGPFTFEDIENDTLNTIKLQKKLEKVKPPKIEKIEETPTKPKKLPLIKLSDNKRFLAPIKNHKKNRARSYRVNKNVSMVEKRNQNFSQEKNQKKSFQNPSHKLPEPERCMIRKKIQEEFLQLKRSVALKMKPLNPYNQKLMKLKNSKILP